MGEKFTYKTGFYILVVVIILLFITLVGGTFILTDIHIKSNREWKIAYDELLEDKKELGSECLELVELQKKEYTKLDNTCKKLANLCEDKIEQYTQALNQCRQQLGQSQSSDQGNELQQLLQILSLFG